MQLEESFLRGQSASFRATMKNVVDRVSISCINHIRSNVVQSCKEETSVTITAKRKEIKKMNKQEMILFLADLQKSAESKIEAAILAFCGPKIETVLAVLLDPDASDPAVFRTVHAICGRRSQERVVNWLNSNIKISDTISKLVVAKDSKLAEDLVIESPKSRYIAEDKDSTMSPPDVLIELQDRLSQCIELREMLLSEQQVVDLINSVQDTVNFRNDLVGSAEHIIYTLTVDLCIVMLAFSPHLVTSRVLQQLCVLWSTCSQRSSLLERILSARNVLLLCQAGSNKAKFSWRHLSDVLVQLLKQGLLTPQQLETQCIALFRQDWPPVVFTLVGACLSSTLEKIKQDPLYETNPKFVLMLEWVNEMTEDLAKDDIVEEI